LLVHSIDGLSILIHATDTCAVFINVKANETFVSPPFAPGILDLEVFVETLGVSRETTRG